MKITTLIFSGFKKSFVNFYLNYMNILSSEWVIMAAEVRNWREDIRVVAKHWKLKFITSVKMGARQCGMFSIRRDRLGVFTQEKHTHTHTHQSLALCQSLILQWTHNSFSRACFPPPPPKESSLKYFSTYHNIISISWRVCVGVRRCAFRNVFLDLRWLKGV